MHLRIISAESNNITDRKLYVRRDSKGKETYIFSQLAFVYILAAGWSRGNKNNELAQGCSRAKKKKTLASAGKAINPFCWNVSLRMLSLSYDNFEAMIG